MLSQIEADIFVHLSQTVGYNEKNAKRKETVPHLFCETVSTSQSASQTAPLPRGASGEEGRLYEMPRPLLDRSNNDDRRQWRKQGVAVGAAASKTQAKRCGCWVPQPGQWHGVSRDGEVKRQAAPWLRTSKFYHSCGFAACFLMGSALLYHLYKYFPSNFHKITKCSLSDGGCL